MRYCIFFLLFINAYCLITAQQHKITDIDNTLSKKELIALDQVIAYQIKFYNKVLSNDSIQAKDVKLRIFSNYAEYITYQKETSKTLRPNSMGFYSSKNKEAVVCKDKIPDRFLNVCYHELSHFFVNTYLGVIPVWINEGLAVYFESTKAGRNPKHIQNQRMINRVKTMIDINDIDLVNFISWDRDLFYKKSFSHESYGYALGYGIISFFIKKDETAVINLIHQILNGENCYNAIDNLYEGGFENFKKDFFQYIKRL